VALSALELGQIKTGKQRLNLRLALLLANGQGLSRVDPRRRFRVMAM
jgi:hypothetical protein